MKNTLNLSKLLKILLKRCSYQNLISMLLSNITKPQFHIKLKYFKKIVQFAIITDLI